MKVGIYQTTLADIEKIQEWFYDAYGIRIRINDAIMMSIHTIFDMSQQFVSNGNGRKTFPAYKYVNIDEQASDELRAIKNMVSFFVQDTDLICNAIVSYRAMTLPRIGRRSAPAIKIKPDL